MGKKSEPKKKPDSKKSDAKAAAVKSPSAKGKVAASAKTPAKPAKAVAQLAHKAAAKPGKDSASKVPARSAATPGAKSKAPSTPPKAAGKPAAGSATANGVAKGSQKPVASRPEPKKADPKKPDKKQTAKAEKPGKTPKAPPEPKPAKEKKSKKKGPIDLSTAKSVAAVAAASQADSSGYVLINGRRVRMISTKGLPGPKKPKAVVEKEVEKSETQVAHIKTKLSKKELDEYKQLLTVKRRQIMGMLTGLEDEALRSSGGNLSTMPLHMADIGTDTFDQDFTLGMAQTERVLLGEINAALGRIENKTYGVCQLTGKPIPKARLEAKPWAKYTVESAKLVERGLVPR